MKNIISASLLFVMLIAAGCAEEIPVITKITNFEECAAAGNPVMESYPRQCSANGQTFSEKLIGGERDEHGCLGPAGYSWSEDIGACIRTWELDESQQKAAKTAVESINPVKGTTVIEVETLRCPGCFNVKLELGLNAGEEIITVKIINWQVSEGTGETKCDADEDCACGTNIMTGECFTGNKEYVNVTRQCPDFCTGIAGNFKTRCVEHVCRNVNILNEGTVCTADAKQCPDGSFVGRIGPNCEFSPCHGEETCKDLCGDGECQEIVCMAIGCPCSETKDSCPQDCG